MVNTHAHLVPNLFEDSIEKKSTRDGFGTGVVAAGKENKNVVVLCADLAESTRAEWFQKEFPDRYIEVGVAEQNLAALASGFAAAGKVPFITSYAAFSPGRNYEQIRTTIALNEQNVKVCGMHAGLSVGPDGATHQMLEDLGLMRMLPHMLVLNPSDAEEARKAVLAAAAHEGPVYIRFVRATVPVYTTPETPFAIGKALTLWEGNEKPVASILVTGALAYEALLAARALEAEGVSVRVVSFPTVKPLDEEALMEEAKRSGRIVTVEEHQVAGGFGSAVAEFYGEHYPMPITRIGVHDVFGQSGEVQELWAHYKVDAAAIIAAVRRS